MKCPLRLEPHQIQGLDFIKMYPVLQWLVKKVLETREEMSDYIRNYSESQFNKERQTPEDIIYLEKYKVKKKKKNNTNFLICIYFFLKK